MGERPSQESTFEFSEHERLYNRLTSERFLALLGDSRTTIHQLRLSENAYGHFAFVTVSRPADSGRKCFSLFGLGYHEYRERWITNEWYWYQTDLFPEIVAEVNTIREALAFLVRRREEIAPYLSEGKQTDRGKLFEALADLTDEDGALAELEDLGDWADELGDSL
jgi:hypothetical protein